MAGLDAFGASFSYSDMGTVPVFTEVANLTNLSGAPAVSRNVIDVTAHDSPDSATEKIGGLIDAQEVSFDLHWDPSDATHQALYDEITAAGANVDYRITASDGAQADFSGFVSSFEASHPVDDKISASVSVTVSGKPTITPGA